MLHLQPDPTASKLSLGAKGFFKATHPSSPNPNTLHPSDSRFTLMADPFTIAVSVARFASLGLQLADTLNKYVGSAVDSKDRAQAIRENINLAVQVFKTLETTVQNDANWAMMNDDSQKLVKEKLGSKSWRIMRIRWLRYRRMNYECGPCQPSPNLWSTSM